MHHNAAKAYLEYYAKELLETLFPQEYFGIRKDESPDLLMGDNRGIEVTWAMFYNQGQANGILNHVIGKNIEEIDQRYIQTMNRLKTDFLTSSDGTINGYIPKDSQNKADYTEILQAYKNKKALQYKTEHTDLFIYPPLAQLDGWLGEKMITECLERLSNDLTNPFEHIIIFEEPTLYLYDTRKNKVQSRRGTEEQILRCKTEADSFSGWSKRDSGL